jgi:hypothetical protein
VITCGALPRTQSDFSFLIPETPEYKKSTDLEIFLKNLFLFGGPVDLLDEFSMSQDLRFLFPISENLRVQKISQFGTLFEKSIFGPPRGKGPVDP